ESKNPDLFALAMTHDFGRDLGALHLGGAGLDVLAVARDQDVVERHLVAGLRREQRDLDRDARLGAELLAAGCEDCVGHRARNLNSYLSLVKRRRTAPSRDRKSV